MRAPIMGVLVCALATAMTAAASAQLPVKLQTRPPDSLRSDSTRADSLRPKRDTLSATDRLLQVTSAGTAHLNPLARCGVSSLQPGSTRISFDRDSIDWVAAQSVGELLARVPGVFLERSDFFGTPELPNFAGRGAASVEYVQDCVPMPPIGPDSIAVDPSGIPLGILERVEIERAPGLLRVFLFTLRQDRQATRTRIGVGQGDRGLARYSGSFERRYPGGMGLSLGADYVGVNPQNNGTGGGNTPSGWLQLGYVPSAHFGVQAQLITRFVTRNVLVGESAADTLMRAMNGTRTDWQLRGSWRQRDDGIGSSLDLFVAHTGWSADTGAAPAPIAQLGMVAARRGADWSAQFSAWHYSRLTSIDSRLDLGWAPTSRLSGSLQLVGQRHDGDRTSQWATARVGITLPAGFSIGAMVSDGHRVQAPALTTDLAQRFTDEQLTAGFTSTMLAVDGGYLHNEGWRPLAFQEFAAVPALAPLAETNWVIAHARLAPLRWLTFETLYQNPVSDGSTDAIPPQHFLSTGTIRSRFLHNFPSGIFDLKLQAVLENWGDGVGGRDANGNPIPLPGATFFRSVIQFQIGPFIAYYDRINLKATKTGYVPGYQIQPVGTSFGIRWEFHN